MVLVRKSSAVRRAELKERSRAWYEENVAKRSDDGRHVATIKNVPLVEKSKEPAPQQ